MGSHLYLYRLSQDLPCVTLGFYTTLGRGSVPLCYQTLKYPPPPTTKHWLSAAPSPCNRFLKSPDLEYRVWIWLLGR